MHRPRHFSGERRSPRRVVVNRLLPWCSEQLRVKIAPVFLWRLVLLYLDAVSVGVGVLANAGYLPGGFHAGVVGVDDEAIATDLLGDDGLRELPDHGELVAEVAIESFKVIGQDYGGETLFAGCDDTVVDVHHVGRFDEGVIEILVRRIERMIYFE